MHLRNSGDLQSFKALLKIGKVLHEILRWFPSLLFFPFLFSKIYLFEIQR